MKTRTKALIAILAAVIYVTVEGYIQSEKSVPAPQAAALFVPAPYSNDTNLTKLRAWYAEYNEEFFDNSLPTDVKIDLSLRNGRMAESSFPEFKAYRISFDPHYVASERVGRFTLLHEMCHVKTWGETTDSYHGPRWRTCMLQIDLNDGFRNIIIDKYQRGPQ